MVVTNDAYGTGGALAFTKATTNTTIQVAYTNVIDPVDSGFPTTVAGLKKARCKVILAFLHPENNVIVRLITEVHDAGLMAPGYSWIFSESLPIEFYTGRIANSTLEQMETILAGSFAIFPVSGTGAKFESFKSSWSALGRDTTTVGFLETYTYDAVYMLAYALDTMVKLNQPVTDGALLLQTLQASNFTGASGVVVVDSNGDRLG